MDNSFYYRGKAFVIGKEQTPIFFKYLVRKFQSKQLHDNIDIS